MARSLVTRGERLDQYVCGQITQISRASAARLIEAGRVQVNGETVVKAGYKLRENDQIEIDYHQAEAAAIPDIELPVLYQDKACLVINKPAGVLTHSKGAFDPEATVATWLSTKTQDMTGERAGIVHRLDRATSGVMICAKTPEALAWLQKQFSQRKVKKAYIAVVKGEITPPQAIIDMPIERNPKKPQTFRVGANGKPAVTEYRVIKTNGVLTRLELRPTTGRTHQLRVHLQQLGHPIVGDTLYGGQPAERLYLHAHQLEITLPSKQRQLFEAPVPADFERLV